MEMRLELQQDVMPVYIHTPTGEIFRFTSQQFDLLVLLVDYNLRRCNKPRNTAEQDMFDGLKQVQKYFMR